MWTDIRRRVLTGQTSKRAICREYNTHWRTLEKILSHEEPPGYRTAQPRPRPVMEAFLPIIEEILEQDKTSHAKERHTAKRIYDRLRQEQQFTGSYSSVKEVVRELKRKQQEVFISLDHPAASAQVDFGEVKIQLNGELVKAALFEMTLPYSGAIFCQVFPRECTETFQEGHRRAFEFFGGVPIGVIDSSRGDSPIQPFIPRAAFDAHSTLRRELELGDQGDLEAIWRLPGGVRARDANWLPARLFHSRLSPISRFATRGVIWYQGESNSGVKEDPRDYQHKMRALVNGWRKAFGDKNMPVYFVQLPGSGAGEGWPYLREQQRLAADLPHTGMVVTIDLAGAGIHPANKIDVGHRLARWALANDYGKEIAFSGPMFERQEIQGDKVVLHFKHAESGLMAATKDGLAAPSETPDAELSHFEVADKSGVWRPATAKIEGKMVVVSSTTVKLPAAVRYACDASPANCNFYNRAGLPAAPFCSRSDLLEYDPRLPE
ncbi:sialate O-acetylesterase [Lignipirellula cremea]|nr:sialate O-acetylesterase [Lignipirellula cremea]